MKKIHLIFCSLSIIVTLGLVSCQKCKTCTYNSGNSPESTYCDDELSEKEKDPNYVCS